MGGKKGDISPRFGIGEWFGQSLIKLTGEERQKYAEKALKGIKSPGYPDCPFQLHKPEGKRTCSKPGGVCSIRLYTYKEHPQNGRACGEAAKGEQGALRATCPNRFYEGLEIFKWIGEVILNDAAPQLVKEVGFLEAESTVDSDAGEDVGKIDMVLVSKKDGAHPEWCAVEIQAVYFSGGAMGPEFKAFSDHAVDWVIYPTGKRHPDYRSSAPKRLMPQLQIKVPALRRWGKKMAVVVDRSFFDSMGKMDHAKDISNADIAWFIVRWEEDPKQKQSRLVRDEVQFTTLERSIEGLTGGNPISRREFESRVFTKKPFHAFEDPSQGALS